MMTIELNKVGMAYRNGYEVGRLRTGGKLIKKVSNSTTEMPNPLMEMPNPLTEMAFPLIKTPIPLIEMANPLIETPN